jgi:hypothetical protein
MAILMAPYLNQRPQERVAALVKLFHGASAPGHCMGAKAPNHPITALCPSQHCGSEDSKA